MLLLHFYGLSSGNPDAIFTVNFTDVFYTTWKSHSTNLGNRCQADAMESSGIQSHFPPSGVQIYTTSHGGELGASIVLLPEEQQRTPPSSWECWKPLYDSSIWWPGRDGIYKMFIWHKHRMFCICNVFLVVGELCYIQVMLLLIHDLLWNNSSWVARTLP